MCSDIVLACMFVCQAEDGIRDLVRSRGLGDVYKRQFNTSLMMRKILLKVVLLFALATNGDIFQKMGPISVSYTHLTLPTSDLV